MRIYEYECGGCDTHYIIEQKITDRPKKKCPNCKAFALERLLFPPLIFVRGGTPTTLGQMAEKNTKKLGKEQIEKMQDRVIDNKKKSRQELAKKLPSNAKLADIPDDNKSFYNTTGESLKQLTKLTPEKKQHYIMTGQL